MKHASAEERATLLEVLRARLAQQPEVLCAYLHGSFAAGGPYRDIDVGVFLDRSRSDDQARYVVDLAAELTVTLGQPVDVTVLNDASPAFRYHVLGALDICNHLAARRGGRSPRDYADCIAILAEIGAIDEDLKNRMVKMARFRDLLVHLYDRLDDRRVYQVVQRDLGDFDRYLARIGQYLGADLC